jgi:outer membrane lipoprotein-sorting protein
MRTFLVQSRSRRAMALASLLAAALLTAVALPIVRADDPLFTDPRALAAVDHFARTWGAARSATYRIVKTERLRSDKVVIEELAIKYLKPGRVYVRMVRPVPNREMIYDRTRDKRKLVVHNGQFPDLTLRLDVRGMLATNDQHHTIEQLGFDQALLTFQTALAEARKEGHGERLEYAGEGVFAGRKVHKVAMLTGRKQAREEVAREDESLFDFARRVGQDPYVIYVQNPDIRALHSELDEGERYVVPAYYAERCESWHDQETGMPLRQAMYSRGKLYESYEHFDIQLDVPLTEKDFDPENPAYGF